MTTVAALFSQEDDLSPIVEKLDNDDGVKDFGIYSHASDAGPDAVGVAGPAYFGMEQRAAMPVVGTLGDLDTSGLDDEVVSYFSKQLRQGGQLLVVKCNGDADDRIARLLEEAGGRTSQSH